MYLIVDRAGRYLKTTVAHNTVTFTTNEILADTFNSEKEAADFICKTFSRIKRRFYKPIYIENIPPPNHGIDTTDGLKNKVLVLENCITAFDKTIDIYLTPAISSYTTELEKFDGMILDIRHYLRDKNTKLNACQGWQVMSTLQKLERERADCKKELQRLCMLKGSIQKACVKSKEFEYEKYKNREIDNVAEFIFSERKSQ